MYIASARFLLLFVICFLSFEASSSSCSPFEDRLYAQCSEGVCSDFLFIAEVRSFEACGRRPVLREPPAWAKQLTEHEIGARKTEGSGIFETKYYRQSYEEQIDQVVIEAYIGGEADQRSLIFFKPTLRKVGGQDLHHLRSNWADRSRSEKTASDLKLALGWAELLIALCFLGFSARSFVFWVRRTGGAVSLILSLGAQVTLFALATISLNSLSPRPMGLLFLVVPVVWIAQGAYFAFSQFTSAKT